MVVFGSEPLGLWSSPAVEVYPQATPEHERAAAKTAGKPVSGVGAAVPGKPGYVKCGTDPAFALSPQLVADLTGNHGECRCFGQFDGPAYMDHLPYNANTLAEEHKHLNRRKPYRIFFIFSK